MLEILYTTQHLTKPLLQSDNNVCLSDKPEISVLPGILGIDQFNLFNIRQHVSKTHRIIQTNLVFSKQCSNHLVTLHLTEILPNTSSGLPQMLKSHAAFSSIWIGMLPLFHQAHEANVQGRTGQRLVQKSQDHD